MANGASGQQLLVTNVRIFDGLGGAPTSGHVVVQGDKIASVILDGPAPETSPDATVIDGAGRVLMPGLTDAHVHVIAAGCTMADLMFAGTGLGYLKGLAEAGRMLMRGFTTVRDMAGDTAALKQVIDAGLFPGPRIYPSQAAISQTSGHGDFGMVYDTPTALGGIASRGEQIGFMRVADGPDRVLAAVREQLKKGASQIKLMAGGGVTSTFDPLDVTQFTEGELRAAVCAADDWGTYVAVHVYTDRGVRRAVDAGVRCIEHGHLASEDTIAMLADKQIWLSTQPFEATDHVYPTAAQSAKNEAVCAGVANTFEWARKHGVKVAFGTDLLLEPAEAHRQIEMFTRLAEYMDPSEALRMGTSGNAELFRMSGERDPYREAPLGVIAEGAWADMLVVNGDPTRDLGILADPDSALAVIIKDGRVFKNQLA